MRDPLHPLSVRRVGGHWIDDASAILFSYFLFLAVGYGVDRAETSMILTYKDLW